MTHTRPVFFSRVDGWILAIGPVTGLAAVGMALPPALRSGATAEVAVLGIVIASTLILPIWLLLDTHYTFTADTLRANSNHASNERFFVRFAGLRKGGPVRRMESLPYDNARAAQSHRTR